MAIRGTLYQPIDLDKQEATTSSNESAGDMQSSLLNVIGLQVTFQSESSNMMVQMLKNKIGYLLVIITDAVKISFLLQVKMDE